jgi:hypothetical protein
MSSLPIGAPVGGGVTVGSDEVGAADVGLRDIVGAGVGISSILQSGKKLKHSSPLGQSILRPEGQCISRVQFADASR